MWQRAFKKTSKLINFCVAILILKMEKNMQHFWHIMLYYSKKGKNTTGMQNKRFVQCMEKALWLIKGNKSGLWSFVLEISCWRMLPNWRNQLKLIVIKSKHWEQSMLYHVGDCWHTQNIEINRVISENKKCVFYFTKKNHMDFLANPIEYIGFSNSWIWGVRNNRIRWLVF